MLAESLPNAPTVLPVCLHCSWERSPTIRRAEALRIRNFGTVLEPRWIIGTERLDQ